MVYVISKSGQPLMPTNRCGRIRWLIKTKQAKVIKRYPFTVQLLVETTKYTQPITLGVDAGSKHVGLSASSEKKEYFQGELLLRNDVVSLLKTRRERRRTRRNRKTRYRKVRFNNRVKSKHKGWLAPSVEVKIQEHITIIKSLCKIMPITKVIVETAEFDLQALKAEKQGKPKPIGSEYQHGEKFGFYNTRQYVLFRDGYKCRCCGKKHSEKREIKLYVVNSLGLETESPEDTYTVCRECFNKYVNVGFPFKKKRYWTHPTFMGIMRDTLMKRLKEELAMAVEQTTGADTKETRESHGIKKSHINDTLCIAKHPKAERCKEVFLIKALRTHNRQIHKMTVLKGGVRKRNQAEYVIKEYRLFDKVLYNKEECFIQGRRSSGYFQLKKLDGTLISVSACYKHLQLLETRKHYIVERREAIFPTAEACGFSCL